MPWYKIFGRAAVSLSLTFSLSLMDPITAAGLAGNVINFVEAAGAVIIKLYRYYLDVKESPARIAGLREEIGLSLSLLGGLHERLTTDSTFQSTPGLGDALLALFRAVKQVDEKIRPEIAKGLRKLKWPFLKEETDDLIQKLGRYNAIFQLAMNIEQTYTSNPDLPNLVATRCGKLLGTLKMLK